MAQRIKFRRSSVAGRIPTTASLSLGELAFNTADGKVFFQRGDETIQSFFTTNALITGSFQQSGSDSYFLSKLGIGTTTPARDLHIVSDDSVNIRLESNLNKSTAIEFRNNQSPDFMISNEFSDGGFKISTTSGTPKKTFVTIGANDGDVIELSGSVQITGPNSQLSSSGAITANSLSGSFSGSYEGVFVRGRIGDGMVIEEGSTILRSEGFLGLTRAGLGDPSGFVIYSGSTSTTLGSDTLAGTGFKFVGSNADSYITFTDQNGGDLEIKTDKFNLSDNGIITASDALFDGTVIAQNFVQNTVIITGPNTVEPYEDTNFSDYMQGSESEYVLRLDGGLGGDIVNNVEFRLSDPIVITDIKVDKDSTLAGIKSTVTIKNRTDGVSDNPLYFDIQTSRGQSYRQTATQGNIYTLQIDYPSGAGSKTITALSATDLSIPITGSTDGINILGDLNLTTISGQESTYGNLRANKGYFTDGITVTGSINHDGDLTVTGTVTAQEFKTEFVSASIIYQSGSTKFGDTADDTHSFTGSLEVSGGISATGDLSIRDFPSVSSSLASGGKITYDSASGANFDLTNIQVNDYDDNVAVNFVNGKLTFTFGTPEVPSSINSSLSGFATNRFNQVTDNYTINGTWSNGGYTLISASLYEGSTLLEEVGTGTSLSFNTTTSGSHTYRLEYTASSPLDGSIYATSDTVTGTLSKSDPTAPSISRTYNVQLRSGNNIEEGATGSIAFTTSSGALNGWEYTGGSTTPSTSPVTVSATGNVTIQATANYQSPSGDNIPQLTRTKTSTATSGRIRSLRYGTSTATSFSESEIQDIDEWVNNIGTIVVGTTNPNNQQFTITTSAEYIYIIYDKNQSDLDGILNVNNSNSNDLGVYTKTEVGNYNVYRSNNLSTTSILYKLTT